MAKSGKERSAEFRARKKESKTDTGHQVVQANLYMSAAHRTVLKQLAQRYSVTTEKMLAMIISGSQYVQNFENEKTDFLEGRFSGAGKLDTEKLDTDSPTDVSDYHGL